MASFFGMFNSNKTFRPQKKFKNDTKRYDLHKHANATLGSLDLEEAVQLPEGEDINEWLAVNVVDFYNRASLVYGTIAEYCTEESCPVMSAGPRYIYYWKDGKEYKKATEVSAPVYIDLLMAWIEDQINDEEIFPTSTDTPFPSNYETVIKNIFKRLFRVYAHIYYLHFSEIQSLGAEAHLNTTFRHFYYFVSEFKLMDSKSLEPLQDLIDNRQLDD